MSGFCEFGVAGAFRLGMTGAGRGGKMTKNETLTPHNSETFGLIWPKFAMQLPVVRCYKPGRAYLSKTFHLLVVFGPVIRFDGTARLSLGPWGR